MMKLIPFLLGTSKKRRSLIRNSYPSNRPDLKPLWHLSWGNGTFGVDYKNYGFSLKDRSRWGKTTYTIYNVVFEKVFFSLEVSITAGIQNKHHKGRW